MIDERQEEAAALYALDLLEPAECAGFEARLDRDPELRRRVRELREAAAALARTASPADPPAALKERVLASIEARHAKGGSASRTLPFSALLPWAIAACLALCSAWAARLYLTSRSETAALRDQRTIADLDLRSVRNQLEAERIVNQRELTDTRQDLADASRRLRDLNRQIADLSRQQKGSGSLADYKIADLASTAGNSPQTLAVAVWCPSMQEGILAVSNLPRLPSGKDYQLWIIDPHYAAPVSGGVFAVNPATGEAYVTFRTGQPIKSIAKFAVSLERKGGAVEPEGPIVLLSDSPRQPSS
jgi:anti-sigma-K factor RskA